MDYSIKRVSTHAARMHPRHAMPFDDCSVDTVKALILNNDSIQGVDSVTLIDSMMKEQQKTKEFLIQIMTMIESLQNGYLEQLERADKAENELLNLRSKTMVEMKKTHNEIAMASSRISQNDEGLSLYKQRASLTKWLRKELDEVKKSRDKYKEELHDAKKVASDWKRRYTSSQMHLRLTKEKLHKANSK